MNKDASVILVSLNSNVTILWILQQLSVLGTFDHN